jgi:putative membrane protein
MKYTMIPVAVMMMASSAWGQSATETTGINSVLGVAPSTQDFVTEAATSDRFEIESSRLALGRSNPTTEEFARQMIEAHTKTTHELQQLVASGKVKAELPAAVQEARRNRLAALEKLSAKDFVQQYHADQVEAHEAAVDLFSRYSKEGENPDLKAWATATLPHLQHHLEMAKQLSQ